MFKEIWNSSAVITIENLTVTASTGQFFFFMEQTSEKGMVTAELDISKCSVDICVKYCLLWSSWRDITKGTHGCEIPNSHQTVKEFPKFCWKYRPWWYVTGLYFSIHSGKRKLWVQRSSVIAKRKCTLHILKDSTSRNGGHCSLQQKSMHSGQKAVSWLLNTALLQTDRPEKMHFDF